MKKFICIIMILLTMSLFIFSASPSVDFAEANKYYENGEYKKALEIYLKISKEITNWKLFYNIGNSYFKLRDPVKAKINYLKAKKLKPFNESIRMNLRIIDDQLNNNIRLPDPDFLSRVLLKMGSVISINMLSYILLFVLFILSYFLFRLIRTGKDKKNIYGVLISLFLLVLFTTYHIHKIKDFNTTKLAVVTLPGSKLRSGPGNNNTVLFDITPGVTVRIIKTNSNWVQITASPEIAGWIETKNIERICL